MRPLFIAQPRIRSSSSAVPSFPVGTNAVHVPQSSERRSFLLGLLAAGASPAVLPLLAPPAASAARFKWQAELEKTYDLDPLRAFWAEIVGVAATRLGPAFGADPPALAFYHPLSLDVPTGAPGDPSREYKRSDCGAFSEGQARPYPICPDDPSDPGAGCSISGGAGVPACKACCRHYAYAVPGSRLALARVDRATTIVIAPRASRLPPTAWRAILLHELGHAIDFFCFGDRYYMSDKIGTVPKSDMAVIEGLLRIDDGLQAPEFRADAFGSLVASWMLGPPTKICYDSDRLVQDLVPSSTPCAPVTESDAPSDIPRILSGSAPGGSGGEGSGSTWQYLEHFPHPPVRGKVPAAAQRKVAPRV